MKYYYLFDDDGYVFSERQTNSPLIPTDPWYNHPRVKEFDHILVSDKVRLVDNKIVSAQKPEPDVSYDFNRRRAYPSIARQLEMLADDIEAAVTATLDAGYRTGDIMQPGMNHVGCKAMGEAVLKQLAK